MKTYNIYIKHKVLNFITPAKTSRGSYKVRNIYLIYINRINNNNIIGIGEASPLPDLSIDALSHDEYMHTLRLIADEVEITGTINYQKWKNYPSILFGIETALQQLKVNGSIDLFNTKFGQGKIGITINGLIWMGEYYQMIKQIDKKIENGFHCIKLKIGSIDFEKEIEMISYIRSRYDKNTIELRVDANGAFSSKDSLNKLERLSKFDIHSIEQPIKQGQWDEMAKLSEISPVPIALDEELIGINTRTEKINLLDKIKPQYIVLKPTLHGGIKGTIEWITLAKERGIKSWITSALESNIGLNAIAQLSAMVYNDEENLLPQGLGTGLLFKDNFKMPLTIKGEKLWIKNDEN